MPTNLPPEYFEAERRYKEARSNAERIVRLEELISTIPKHKGTDKLRADLRRRLSKLKDATQVSKRTGRHESSFHIEREGAGRVAVVGLPNVGKSSLVDVLTHATPKVSEYPFTSWTPTPGMMIYQNIQIQLIDTPPLNREHVEAELFDLIRGCDLILLVVDLQADPIRQIKEGMAILMENRIYCKTIPSDDEKLSALPLLLVVNKNDDKSFDEDFELFCELMEENCAIITVSARTGRNMELFREEVFKMLNIIRVYSKPPGKEVDRSAPFVLKRGGTIEEFAGQVHKDFLEKLKSARVWGSEVYDGQLVGRDHVLHDGDVVELHI
jgi:ribosome-interacting GTPase 1